MSLMQQFCEWWDNSFDSNKPLIRPFSDIGCISKIMMNGFYRLQEPNGTLAVWFFMLHYVVSSWKNDRSGCETQDFISQLWINPSEFQKYLFTSVCGRQSKKIFLNNTARSSKVDPQFFRDHFHNFKRVCLTFTCSKKWLIRWQEIRTDM